jgi:ribonuclease HII
MSSKPFPSLELELSLAARFGCRFVVGVDEVGRGAIAGPVSVGVAVIDLSQTRTSWPTGLQDSKLLSEPKRDAIAPLVAEWVVGWAVGDASVEEIETVGITRALAIAAKNALGKLSVPELTRANTILLLDGKHNWLAPVSGGVPVVTQIKADQTAVIVSCASVLAKVHRDTIMREKDAEFAPYGFAGNKGYAAAAHIEALRAIGPSEFHRLSWLTKILQSDDTPTT